jgi:ParB-like chromosome segregation protein Spo0J
MIINGFAATIQHVSPTRCDFGLHAAAKQFPEAGEEDRASLRASIVANGFTETQPIIVYAGKNEIVEGRTRWSILKDLAYEQQVPVAFVEFPDDAAAKKFALAQNLGRRHLTRAQRDVMMSELVIDGYDVKELAVMFGVSDSLVTKITTDARALLEEERNVQIVALIDQGKKQTEVADLVGVNAATVSRVMQKRNKSEIASDGKSWLSVRPKIDPVVKPTEIDPLKITSSDADETTTETVTHEPTKADLKMERMVERRVEQKLKVERKALEKTVGQRVDQEVRVIMETKYYPTYGRRVELAEKIIAAQKGIMKKGEYRRILACLHPDTAADEETKKKLASVFDLFKSFEVLLLEPKTEELAPLSEVIEEFLAKKKAA